MPEQKEDIKTIGIDLRMYFPSAGHLCEEELKEDVEEERKDRREIIPSMFSNSRNQ
jgi:hypothetical protein